MEINKKEILAHNENSSIATSFRDGKLHHRAIFHTHRKTAVSAILMVMFCTGLTAFAQLMLKIGSADLAFNISALLTNVPLVIGASVYVFSSFIFITALKYGELSVLYPIFALSYIWVNLLSANYLGEALNLFKWIGIGFILLGVWLIGWGSNK